VRRLRGELCRLEDCPDAIRYLDSRGLWPATAETTLRAHPSVEYYDSGQRIDRFQALVADVRDAAGELVTTHVTYLANGTKLTEHEPRKILSPLVGREACAVRLYAITGGSMGIAEGLETAISAAILHELPVWAALNTALLQRFTPPAGVDRLVIFADRDLPGMTAAAALLERLQGGKARVEVRTPPAPHKDWNDMLQQGAR
jgi:putative DNA primase/helicase